jgi:Na+/H+ antiporter NhaD/arsenite permease-like protein
LQTAALLIFIVTYIGIIFTKLPWLSIDRPSAAFFGAVMMIVFGVVSFPEAVSAIDFNTIGLLLGMMILITVLENDGFFTIIAQKTISISTNPSQLLFVIIFITGLSSAFLVNDAVVLLFTPVVIKICKLKKLNPVPYLIAEIMSSNAGSVLTITGNPQNIIIGIKSGIAYGSFLLYMLPVSVISMLLIYLVIKIIYKKEFPKEFIICDNSEDQKVDYSLMKLSVPIFIIVVAAFFLSREIKLSYPMIALTGASLALLFGKTKPSKLIKEIDWVLLLFFASLFIVVYGFDKSGYLTQFIGSFNISKNISGVIPLHIIGLILSQVVSNVPYTVLMVPTLSRLNDTRLWMTLASSSTLAGNLTIIGAMANLIVIGIAKSAKIEIKFFEFMKAGMIVTILTFIISAIWLMIAPF